MNPRHDSYGLTKHLLQIFRSGLLNGVASETRKMFCGEFYDAIFVPGQQVDRNRNATFVLYSSCNASTGSHLNDVFKAEYVHRKFKAKRP